MIRVPTRHGHEATTLRRILGMAALGVAVPAWAEPISEADLIRRVLAAPIAVADLDAVEAQTRADRTSSSSLDSPTVGARHEDVVGDATTTALGGSVTLDLGLSPLAGARASRLLADAGAHRRAAVALATACGVRADALELWAANLSVVASLDAQERLNRLLATMEAFEGAGESSAYDRDRTAMAVVAHRTEVDDWVGEAERLRALLTSLAGGEPVVDVVLATLSPAPGLDASLAELANHPALLSASLQAGAAKAQRTAAQLDQIPDLTVSGARRWEKTPTGNAQGFEFGGSVEVPWMNGDRAEARHQGAEHAAMEARRVRAEAELVGAVRGAHRRVAALAVAPAVASDPEAVWTAAMDRYISAETTLDELLQVAEAVEAARLAIVERQRLIRSAHLDLSCAVGRFPDPAIQSVVEEAAR